jgi:Flp pilus assembly protein TadG
MQLGWKTCRRLARDARGSEIAETAMVVPLFFMIFLGIFWFGQAFRIYGAITSAARDGARAAVAPSCTTCAGVDPTTNAWNIIQSDLQAAHIDPNVLQQPTNPPALCACGGTGSIANCTSTTVSCDSSQSNICVQGVNHSGKNNTLNETYVQLSPTVASGALTTGAGECGVSVSFQYPFSFSLPFTSLDWQVVNLRAQAQMRAEYQ